MLPSTPREGSQIFVDRLRRDGSVIDDMVALIEPGEERAFVADDQPFRNARRERQDPPPHRALRHCLRRVGKHLPQHLSEHDRGFDIKQPQQCRGYGNPNASLLGR
jgi:hypothetical protein